MNPIEALLWLAGVPPALGGGVMVAAALVTGCVAAGSLLRRDRRRGGRTWRRLCRRLGVAGAQRRLIERAAAALSVPGGALLVSRGCFDDAVDQLPVRGDERRRLADVRRKVFSSD